MATTTLLRPAPKIVPRERPRTPAPSARPAPRSRADAGNDFLDRLDRMGCERRLAAYNSGRFNRHERAIWAARFPDEVPRVNGEIEWIALALADLD